MLHLSIEVSNTKDIGKEIARLEGWGKTKGLTASEVELLCAQAQTALSDLGRAAHAVSASGSTFHGSRQIRAPNCIVEITFSAGIRRSFFDRLLRKFGVG
jgi:hypothetical protein